MATWSVIAAFGTYFCMYGFRKPFTAGTYLDVTLWGIDYKTVLVTSQVMGYMVSKFIGIKVVAELQPKRRAVGILILIGIAEFALLLFGLVPAPYNCICLFLNGLPLGMVFGLVLGFLEGRRQTEALTAGLCASFILADGVTKSVGAWLLEIGVMEYWMPGASGLVFALPLLVFVWMLTRIPVPTTADVAARSERSPMTRSDRRKLFWNYAPGLILLVIAYLLVTILRSIRADFQLEIWDGLGLDVDPEMYALSETFVALGSIILFGLIVFVRNNRRAFFLAIALAIAGSILIAVALAANGAGNLSPFAFMVLIGLGKYLPYVAVHTTVFERLIAMTRDRGNIGYLLYLADAFGYLGYVAVVLGKNVWGGPASFLDFFLTTSWIIAGSSALMLVGCWIYFASHSATTRRS